MHNKSAPFAILDDAQRQHARCYDHFSHSDYLTSAELNQLDSLLQQGWAQNLHSVLSLPYDFGRDLIGIAQTNCPLRIDWYKRLTVRENNAIDHYLHSLIPTPDQPAGIAQAQFQLSPEAYQQTIAQIHDHIRAGDCYQINFCDRIHFRSFGHPIALYRALRQAQIVPYAVLHYHPQHHWLLSLSPELFFRLNDGNIQAQPMKGTAPILNDGNDAQRATQLQHDPKNRAENLMIVDLLRNDLSKIAQPHSVIVKDAFNVRPFGRVWQMTSTVQATLKPNTSLADIIRATFPCGSITGAPKHKVMQLIDALEQTPRGHYTGSIGYVEPSPASNPAFNSVFNVAIRTLTINPDGRGRYGVGGGITIDSQAQEEYQECQWKSQLLHKLAKPFTLIETMRCEQGQIALLNAHLERLQQSAHDLGFRYHHRQTQEQIQRHLQTLKPNSHHRLKLQLSADGNITLEHGDLTPLSAPVTIGIHPDTLPRHDVLRRYKTSQRQTYDHAWQQAQTQGAFDNLVFNHAGILLEGGRSNVFIYHQGQWLTPALSLDLLNGIMRQQILNHPQRHLNHHQVLEAEITLEMLQQAQRIVLSNALRGTLEARPLKRDKIIARKT